MLTSWKRSRRCRPIVQPSNERYQRTEAITNICDDLKGVEIKVNINEDNVKKMTSRVTELQERSEEAERYSRRWNLRLYLPETRNEDVRKEIFNVLAKITPKTGKNLDTWWTRCTETDTPETTRQPGLLSCNTPCAHLETRYGEHSMTRKSWKRESFVWKRICHLERQLRHKLWPLVDKARKEGKRAGYAYNRWEERDNLTTSAIDPTNLGWPSRSRQARFTLIMTILLHGQFLVYMWYLVLFRGFFLFSQVPLLSDYLRVTILHLLYRHLVQSYFVHLWQTSKFSSLKVTSLNVRGIRDSMKKEIYFNLQ